MTVSRNEDEGERAEKVEKGTKVRRTLSSLRNRMTGSFNKDKVAGPPAPQTAATLTQPLNPPSVSVLPQGKNREKGRQRGREAAGGARSSGGSSHRLVPGSFSSCATCSLCSKTLQKKHGLQCMSE